MRCMSDCGYSFSHDLMRSDWFLANQIRLRRIFSLAPRSSLVLQDIAGTALAFRLHIVRVCSTQRFNGPLLTIAAAIFCEPGVPCLRSGLIAPHAASPGPQPGLRLGIVRATGIGAGRSLGIGTAYRSKSRLQASAGRRSPCRRFSRTHGRGFYTAVMP